MRAGLGQRLDALAHRGRAGLAWEVLRRNPEYVAMFADANSSPAAGEAGPPGVDAPGDWGLHFRRGSRP
ncbi:transcriptional regulator domain-containing protein [Novosphingobium fluoreni]|uniref:transcriptional regulator domain-containing protein n=1 Tax=Novosphingobium fluoreni TaxID=1391222 RepID=UPI001C851029